MYSTNMYNVRNTHAALESYTQIISVGTMGAAGAAAPTIFSQWVQTMYSAPTIFWNKSILSITESQKTNCFMNKLSQYQSNLVNISQYQVNIRVK